MTCCMDYCTILLKAVGLLYLQRRLNEKTNKEEKR
ncbi:hypothetical protein [Shigella phage ESh21]|nr:hypothetical protein [Shigella phage ESh21]